MSNAPNEELVTYKLMVVGDGGVGKSALATQFIENSFDTDYYPAIERPFIKHTEVDHKWCVIDVLDTDGQDDFPALREHYMRNSDGFLLVYSVIDKQSFDNITHFYSQILRVKDRDSYPMLLVANKMDLAHLRMVQEEQGRKIAKLLKVPYIETSAKNPLNVDWAFHEVVRIIRNGPQNSDKRRGLCWRRKNKKCFIQ